MSSHGVITEVSSAQYVRCKCTRQYSAGDVTMKQPTHNSNSYPTPQSHLSRSALLWTLWRTKNVPPWKLSYVCHSLCPEKTPSSKTRVRCTDMCMYVTPYGVPRTFLTISFKNCSSTFGNEGVTCNACIIERLHANFQTLLRSVEIHLLKRSSLQLTKANERLRRTAHKSQSST